CPYTTLFRSRDAGGGACGVRGADARGRRAARRRRRVAPVAAPVRGGAQRRAAAPQCRLPGARARRGSGRAARALRRPDGARRRDVVAPGAVGRGRDRRDRAVGLGGCPARCRFGAARGLPGGDPARDAGTRRALRGPHPVRERGGDARDAMSAGETTPRPGPGTRALRQLGLAVAASFVAGLSVGVALPKIREAFAGPAADDPWAVYVTALTDDYGLSNDQVRKLRMVMAAWEQERNELLSRHAGALPRPLQNDINDA